MDRAGSVLQHRPVPGGIRDVTSDDGAAARACGACRACCSGPEIAALGKARFERCVHLTQRGCGIYGRHPESCKHYECLWKKGEGLLLHAERPDALGVYFDLHPSKYDGRTGEVLASTLDAWETHPGSIDTDRAHAALERLVARCLAADGTLEGVEVVRFGDPAFYWIAHAGGTPFAVRERELLEVGEVALPFVRRVPRQRLDVIE